VLPPDASASSEFLLFGVFDGHGSQGKQAARKARDTMHSFLNENFTQTGTSVDAPLMQSAFVAAHSAIVQNAAADFGTTAVLAAIHLPTAKLCFGWVGDSKAIICRRNNHPTSNHPNTNNTMAVDDDQKAQEPFVVPTLPKTAYYAIELTEDHVPTLPKEEDRIYASGGIIRTLNGMARIFVPELYASFYGVRVGGLNMSRALGHKYLSRFGVIPDPEFGTQQLLDDDLVILASDGLWGKISPEEVASLISNKPTIHSSPEQICKMLMEESKRRWGSNGDNITIVVISLSPFLQGNIIT